MRRGAPPNAAITTLDFRLTGVVGDRLIAKVQPQRNFQAEKFMATDTSSQGGYGTRIIAVYVGSSLQRPMPPANGTLTAMYTSDALGNAVRWDVAAPPVDITVEVAFDAACTWHGTAIGKMWD